MIQIEQKLIGAGQPPYIIAEMSANHNGDLDRAKGIIRTAAAAGADAIKLQTYTADTMTIDHDSDEFLIKGGLWDGRKLYELYKQAYTPWEWHKELFETASQVGITIFSSPFDPTAVDFLEDLNVPAYKIASFELLDIPLVQKVASTGKPVIISTGNADLGEIEDALSAVKSTGNEQVALLHCTSAYPTPVKEANLSTIAVMKDVFNCEVGLSDHTTGIGTSVAAVALGASIIEKHFTLSRADGGLDAPFSLEPKELKLLIDNCRIANLSIGKPTFTSTRSELLTKAHRRSLYVVKDIMRGEIFTEDYVKSIRPGNGLPPKLLPVVLGARATADLAFGTPLGYDDFE